MKMQDMDFSKLQYAIDQIEVPENTSYSALKKMKWLQLVAVHQKYTAIKEQHEQAGSQGIAEHAQRVLSNVERVFEGQTKG